jgi:hypothetical protein
MEYLHENTSMGETYRLEAAGIFTRQIANLAL